jgi:hypothetical protein
MKLDKLKGIVKSTIKEYEILHIIIFSVWGIYALLKQNFIFKNIIRYNKGEEEGNPSLRLVVNSVLDHTTFDEMFDLHMLVMERGFITR